MYWDHFHVWDIDWGFSPCSYLQLVDIPFSLDWYFMGSRGFVIMLLTSHKIPRTNCDNFTLISSRSIFPSPFRGRCSGALSPTSAKRPPGRWRRSTATPNLSRSDGEQRIWIWLWKWGWFGWDGSNMLFNFTKRDDWLRWRAYFWQSHQKQDQISVICWCKTTHLPPCFCWWCNRIMMIKQG